MNTLECQQLLAAHFATVISGMHINCINEWSCDITENKFVYTISALFDTVSGGASSAAVVASTNDIMVFFELELKEPIQSFNLYAPNKEFDLKILKMSSTSYHSVIV